MIVCHWGLCTAPWSDMVQRNYTTRAESAEGQFRLADVDRVEIAGLFISTNRFCICALRTHILLHGMADVKAKRIPDWCIKKKTLQKKSFDKTFIAGTWEDTASKIKSSISLSATRRQWDSGLAQGTWVKTHKEGIYFFVEMPQTLFRHLWKEQCLKTVHNCATTVLRTPRSRKEKMQPWREYRMRLNVVEPTELSECCSWNKTF